MWRLRLAYFFGADPAQLARAIRLRRVKPKRYCSRISTSPPRSAAPRRRDRPQRLLEHHHRDDRAEQHAGFAQRGDDARSAPASSPRSRCRRRRLAARRRQSRAANSARIVGEQRRGRRAKRVRRSIKRRCRRTATAHRTCGIAGNARADAVDHRIGADRHRGEQRKADRAPVEHAPDRGRRAATAATRRAASATMPTQPSELSCSPTKKSAGDRRHQRRRAARDRIDLAEIAGAIGLDQRRRNRTDG